MSTTDITPETNREEVIKVAARSDAKALGSIAARALEDNAKVQMRAIGAAAVNQAVKAIAIARGYVAQRGEDLVCRPGFETTTDITRPGTSGASELSCVVFNISTV
jgi:stage V sporulation protein S